MVPLKINIANSIEGWPINAKLSSERLNGNIIALPSARKTRPTDKLYLTI